MTCYFLGPLIITADLLDQWFGPQSFSQHVAGSTPGSVTFPSAGFDTMHTLQGTPAFPSAEVVRACVHMLSEMSSLVAP